MHPKMPLTSSFNNVTKEPFRADHNEDRNKQLEWKVLSGNVTETSSMHHVLLVTYLHEIFPGIILIAKKFTEMKILGVANFESCSTES